MAAIYGRAQSLIVSLKKAVTSFLFRQEIDWSRYRLGDMVKSSILRAKPGGEPLHLKRYPNTIASRYMLATKTESNYDVLAKLVDEYRIRKNPATDELVVHLRVGEVIEMSEFSVEQLLEKQRAFHNPSQICYVRPLQFYQEVIEHILGQFESVTLVAGGCRTKTFEKSNHYIAVIRKLFEEQGFVVSVRMGNPPDDDFVYMCRARQFVPSGGGFSRFIKGIVEMKGGIIINPQN